MVLVNDAGDGERVREDVILQSILYRTFSINYYLCHDTSVPYHELFSSACNYL